MVISTDFSGHWAERSAMNARQQALEALAETLPNFIWTCDGEGIKTFCNRRYLDYLGIPTIEEMTNAWSVMVHPDDRPGAVRAWQQALTSGEPYFAEYRMRHRDGSYRSFLARAVPVRDNSGRVVQWIGSSTDVHEQRLADEILRRTEKVATAARLAASVAHQINNPLEAVVNAIYLARTDPDLGEKASAYLRIADQELARVAEVTTRSLKFHKQSTRPSVSSLAALMDATFLFYARHFEELGIHIQREYRATSDRLYCSRDEIRQVFSVLLSNCLDALAPNGTLRVRISECASAQGRGLRVTIADNGKGIPRALRPRIFEPFVTSKDLTGTGLGLWISRGIIRNHHGTCSIRSATEGPRRGTTFSIFFPYVDASDDLETNQSVDSGETSPSGVLPAI